MNARAELRSTFWATADLLLAALGIVMVLYPAAWMGHLLFAVPADAETAQLIVGIVAIGGAYPFVAGEWSLGPLGDYIFILYLSWAVLVIISAVALLIIGVGYSPENPVPQAASLVAAYGIAYRLLRFRETD